MSNDIWESWDGKHGYDGPQIESGSTLTVQSYKCECGAPLGEDLRPCSTCGSTEAVLAVGVTSNGGTVSISVVEASAMTLDAFTAESLLATHGTQSCSLEIIEAQLWILAAGMGLPDGSHEERGGPKQKFRWWLDDDPFRSALVGAMCDRDLLEYGTSIRRYWREPLGDQLFAWLLEYGTNPDEWEP